MYDMLVPCLPCTQNYIDADGNIIPDPTIDQLLAEAQDPNRPRRQRGTRKDGPGTGKCCLAWSRCLDVFRQSFWCELILLSSQLSLCVCVFVPSYQT
jgi:hypothetical protein